MVGHIRKKIKKLLRVALLSAVVPRVVLRVVPKVVVTVLLTVAPIVVLGIGPWDRIPGGILAGEKVNKPIEDWSFVADHNRCALEVRPEYPHSITVNCWNVGKQLYIGCRRCESKQWSSIILQNPQARVKIGDKVYPVLAKRIESKADMTIPWETLWKKYGKKEPVDPVPEGYWLFQFSSPND